tara:strand:- start:5184 stop:6698 length:1515 start_codon:yes stop_codon:yes gene_type:complete
MKKSSYKNRKKYMKRLFIGLFILIGFMPFTASAKLAPEGFADLSEKLLPTVVNISISQKFDQKNVLPDLPDLPDGSPFEDFFEEFLDKRQQALPSVPPSTLGSGFVIDAKNGYIVTNNHVIADGENIRITFADDVTLDAELVGTDDKTDLAVLKVDPTKHKLTQANFGNSDKLRIGEWILVIGNPFGLGASVSAGVVSARARDINSGPYDDYIQTDASINKGNSGGPMFDTDGNVVGINTAIFSPTGGSVGIGFAIPSNMAKNVIDQIIQYGRTKRGWLGVRIQEVTPEIAESLGLETAIGALVASPSEGGPAEKAGVQAGDIILEFNGKEIDEMRHLPRIVAETAAGETVNIVIWRDDKKMTLPVTVAELEKAEDEGLLDAQSEAPMQKGEVKLENEGIALSNLSSDLRSFYNIPAEIEGVVITNVNRGTNASEKGLSPGDVIIEANQQKVNTPDQVVEIFGDLRVTGKRSVLLLVNRGGDVRFVALRIEPENKYKKEQPKMK